MRVLFCKIHCPSFICFCKPSSGILTAAPLKLENTPHVPSTIAVSLSGDHDHVSHETDEVKEESVDGNKQQQQQPEQQQPPRQQQQQAGENRPKSSIKKSSLHSKAAQKKSVQWMDFLGKELVEIREFEPSEVEDIDDEGVVHRGCVCTIL